MNNNEFAADDSWSSLAQELGLGDEPSPAAPLIDSPVEPPLPEMPDAEDFEDTALEPDLSSEPSSESDEQGEDGKRRRRRRRRRRKGGGPDSGETIADPADGAEAFDDGTDAAAVEGETPADLAMRDVVANWNVPTWDELIAGLYRPGH